MTDASGEVQNPAKPKFASAQASSDSAQAEPDLQATIAALQAENQRLKAELADAHKQLFPHAQDRSSCPTSLDNIPDSALPKPLLQGLYDFIDQFTIGCAQANLVSGQYAFVNQAFCDMLGYSRDELMAMSFYDITHPDDCDRNQALVQQHVHQPQPTYHLEKRYRHKDGHYIWVDVNVMSVQLPGGRFSPLGVVQEISDRKRIEEELRRSREMLQAVIDNVPQRIFWKDVNSVYLGCNQPQAIAAGLASPEQIIGLCDRDLPWTTAQSDAYFADDTRVIQSDQPLHHVLEIQRQSNGQFRWLDCHKIPLHDAQGRVIGLVGTAEDITERKQAEELLVQQAKRERMLNHVVYAIRNSLNLADIFSATVREVGHFLNMDWVKVVHYDADQAVWRVVEAYQRLSVASSHPVIVGTEIPDAHAPFSAQLKRGHMVKLDSGSLDSIALDSVSLTSLSLDSILQTSASAVESLTDAAIAQRFPGCWLIMPIRLGVQTWGSLTLMRSHPQMQWSVFDIELAQAIAAQLAIAIQQSELYQQVNQLNVTLEQEVRNRTAQLQQAVDFEALLKRITDRVRDSLNETQILNTVVQELVHGLGALSCDSGRYDLDNQTSTIAYEYVDADSTFTPLDTIVCPMANFPHIYQQLLLGQSLQFCWLPERNVLRPFQQPSTALACPIIDDQGVIGDLWLYRAADNHFNEMEVRLAKQVANQCAIAVRQARLYQAAQAQVDELARLNQLKDDFLSTVSHELRTPMSSIQMAVQMLEITFQRLGLQFDLSSPVSTYLQILQSECNREISLINDLLDLSRLEAEVEPLELMPIELNLWLSHIAEPFLERTRLQQQQLVLNLPASLPTIVTDLSYLERAMTELLHNACKYTPPGETIQVAAHADLTHVQITVMNTGITIPDAECDRIFDKFYRIPNGDPWKHGGTGLGLALVKKLVERLDGSITLKNPVNRVIFEMWLPRCHSHAAQEDDTRDLLRSQP